MSDRTKQSVADSLEAEKHILPHMPFLLQDLWALGSSVEHILEIVGSLSLPSQPVNILDLGCGKGAVLIQLASQFGFQVVGIDAMAPFLDEAVKIAATFQVSHLCQFNKNDILEYVTTEREFDLVILASLGGIFGSFKNTVRQLRTQVRSDGYMIIDDGYLREAPRLDRRGYGHYRNHEDTVKELTAYDDILLREINTTDLNLKINDEYFTVIEKRASELSEKHPELKDDLKAYIQLQAEECDVIENQIEGALWLLQKRI